MNTKLIEELSKFYYESVKGIYISEYAKFNNGVVVYSDMIKDHFSNYIQMDSTTRGNFYTEWKENRKKLIARDRKATLYVFPNTNLYDNREKYLKDNFKLESEEVWQIYDNFEDVENIETKCSLNIRLEKTNDMNLYADINDKGFNTNDKDDPYGSLDTEYKKVFLKYKNTNNINYKQEFYIVYNEDIPVGAITLTYNNFIMGIYGLTILREYRKQGIGKDILKQVLILAKNKNLKLAFLQTEHGYYPAKMYSKIGFKDLCMLYIYSENLEFSRKLDINYNLEETEKLLIEQTDQSTVDFSLWTKEKANIKYKKQIPSFPITTHFIYWCKLGINIGSEQNKLRPVIIIRSQTNSPICTILPLTSVRMNDNRWYHIDLEKHNSTAMVEHLRNVSKLRILKPQRENGRIARISQKDVDNINKSIQSYYKLPPIPSN